MSAIFCLNAASAAEPPSFAARLASLAAKCDELNLPEQAAITRAWIIPRYPGRQYLFLATNVDLTLPKAPAPETARLWHNKFLEHRREQAAALFAEAKSASDARQPTRAYQLLYEVLREDPDHAEARRVLGFVQNSRGQWTLPGAEKMSADVSRTANERLNWRAGSFFRLETPHFQIITNHSKAELLEAGEQLENLHALWRQVFFRYWSSPEALAARLSGGQAPLSRERPKMRVVLFKNRQEYAAHVAAAQSKASTALGMYDDKYRIIYFFAGDKSVYPTWYHEATHQLFQESLAGTRDHPGAERNFWALEGVALYMESLTAHAGYWTVGGCEADRLQLPRHHVMSGDVGLPLSRMDALSRQAMQTSDDIGRLYTQAAGLAHFFMDGARGAYREGFVDFVASVYRGEDPADALAKATGQDLSQLDQQFREFLKVTDEDLAGIPDPKRSHKLSLCGCPVTDNGLARFAGSRNLKWLDLSLTAATDDGLKHFASNSGLTQLFLEGSKVTAASLPLIASFKQLEDLDLSRLPITDDDLTHLRGLKQLQHLHYTGTQVTPDGFKRLKAALPKLQ